MKFKFILLILTAGFVLAQPAVAFAVDFDNTIKYDEFMNDDNLKNDDLSNDDLKNDDLENDVSADNVIDDDDLENDVSADNVIDDDDINYNYFYDFYELEEQLYLLNDQISLLSDYSGVNNSIPQLYIEYMKDCLIWKKYGEHYVAYSSSYTLYNNTYYYYVLAFGDLSFNGSFFDGTNMHVYEFFPQVTQYSNYSSYRYSYQSSFYFNPSNFMCFTDLTERYPNIIGLEAFHIRMLLILFILVILFYTFTKFGWGNVRIKRRPKYRNY